MKNLTLQNPELLGFAACHKQELFVAQVLINKVKSKYCGIKVIEIESMTGNVTAGKIYVTAFLDFATFKKFSEQLAWETEVWIADMPDHMIHLNGDKFLGPR